MLFDEGISISTIIGLYRSSVAAINTGFDNEETISNPVFLSRLMRAFFLQKPSIRTLAS